MYLLFTYSEYEIKQCLSDIALYKNIYREYKTCNTWLTPNKIMIFIRLIGKYLKLNIPEYNNSNYCVNVFTKKKYDEVFQNINYKNVSVDT